MWSVGSSRAKPKSSPARIPLYLLGSLQQSNKRKLLHVLHVYWGGSCRHLSNWKAEDFVRPQGREWQHYTTFLQKEVCALLALLTWATCWKYKSLGTLRIYPVTFFWGEAKDCNWAGSFHIKVWAPCPRTHMQRLMAQIGGSGSVLEMTESTEDRIHRWVSD